MAKILTPSGYRDAASLSPGDEVCAFDVVTGAPIVNVIENIEWVDASEWARWHTNAVLPPFMFYRINGRWTLNSEQSIWRNGDGVCHVKHLIVGDEVYDDADHPITITSIAPIVADGWWRFDISGDHSYIADGLTLHNASRFWVGNGGTWDLATTTHWASSTGGGGGQTAPGSADTVTIDASSGTGTITPSFGGTGTFQAITCGAMGMTLDFSVNNNSVTISNSSAFSGTGTGTRTLNLGNGTWSLTTNAANANPWNISTSTNLTFSANSSIIDFTGVISSVQRGQSFSSATLTYNVIKVSGARMPGGLQITGAITFSTINIAAATGLSFSSACTVGTLTVSAQLALILTGSITVTFTNAPTITGTALAPCSLISAEATSGTNDQITCTSGTFGGTWCAIYGLTFAGGASFVFNNSMDLGKNSGATINTISSGGGSIIGG